MAALPKEVQYNKPMASLPAETSSMNVNVRPSNGQVFSRSGGDIIQFDLPAHSFLVPSSLTLRGIITIDPTDAWCFVDTACGDDCRWFAFRIR